MATMDVPAGKGVLHTMDRSGDMRVIWDRNVTSEIDAARTMFESLKKKRYIAYRAIGEKGDKGEIINNFDYTAERIIMVPPMIGG